MRPTAKEKLVIPEKNNFSLFHQYNNLQRETILLNQYKMSTLQYIQSKKKIGWCWIFVELNQKFINKLKTIRE